MSVYSSLCIPQSVCPSVCQSVCLSVSLSLCLSVSLSLFRTGCLSPDGALGTSLVPTNYICHSYTYVYSPFLCLSVCLSPTLSLSPSFPPSLTTSYIGTRMRLLQQHDVHFK